MSVLAARTLRQRAKLRVSIRFEIEAVVLIHRFLHRFPQNMDPNALASAMSRVELSSDNSPQFSPASQQIALPMDDFPDLLAARLGRGSRFDPTRNRFANAVKRAAPVVMPSVKRDRSERVAEYGTWTIFAA